jgi:hypothetical protein
LTVEGAPLCFVPQFRIVRYVNFNTIPKVGSQSRRS